MKKYLSKISKLNHAVTDVFRDLVVLNEEGESFPVPIIWGSWDKACQVLTGHSACKSNVVDRIQLPLSWINLYGIEAEGLLSTYGLSYTLGFATMFNEDAYQLLEQIVSKFTPSFNLGDDEFLSVKNINTNNLWNCVSKEKDGLQPLKVVKWQFDLYLGNVFFPVNK